MTIEGLMGAVIARIALLASVLVPTPCSALAPDCPNDGTVRFAVIPGEDTAQLTPIMDHLSALIASRLDCKVTVQFGTNYTSVIEAMRAARAEVGQFGAFSYVLAHKVAGVDAVATFAGPDGKPSSYYATITTWPGSGITTLSGIKGKPFAFSDPASTSGYLIPTFGMRKAGIDPEKDIRPYYSGSHTASFEALLNHKVPAGELSSVAIAAAKVEGLYKSADFVTLWRSSPIPDGPFATRSGLNPTFKARLTRVLQTLDLSAMPRQDMALLDKQGSRGFTAVDDHDYDGIRDVMAVLHLDLSRVGQ